MADGYPLFCAYLEVYLEGCFENLCHFSIAFKKLFGLTPTALSEQKDNISHR